ncbi:TetR/AcrR family transcriptional regulator [Longispora sp. NPDC051575]|uniref:TetR/AcrR family transcriptional regulator n=1 Tax=Longispora sp. NPDC051575 TaxID=3154943 RepID=UPI0034480ED2
MPVTKGTALDPARTREAILAAATELLYRRGLDGVGVAELCAAVGASKETLYRHFGSKDGLIQAVLEARSDRVHAWISTAVATAPDPAAELHAVFEALGGWFEQPEFRGCAIVNAATQRHSPPARLVAVRHLDRYLEMFTDIAARAGVAEPGELGGQLLILLEGATVVADHHRADGVARLAGRAALTLLHATEKSQP